MGPSLRVVFGGERPLLFRRPSGVGWYKFEVGEVSMASVTLVVKPVSLACNLRCEYCYNEDENLPRRCSLGVMSDEVLICMSERLLDIEQAKSVFIWHGGEPLLAGLDFFRKALDVQGGILRRLKRGRKVVNRIQTNGTLIDAEWAALAKRRNFAFGVSLDGPEVCHDRFRRYSNGHGSFQDTFRGVKLLQQSGLSAGIGAVVSKESLRDPVGIFEFFLRHFRRFDFSPCVECASGNPTGSKYAITPEEYVEFFKVVFGLWWEKDDPGIKVRSFRNYVLATLGKTPEICSMAGTCSSFLCVDANGSIYPCGRFGGLPELCFGSILEQSFPEILEGELYREYQTIASAVPDECAKCKWFYACHNGCTFRRYKGNGEFTDRDPLCEATKEILEFVSEKVGSTHRRLGVAEPEDG